MAARINYLAMDRPDLQYAAKNLCRRMGNPRISDWEKARKIAKYIKGRPRLIMQYPFEEFESKVNGYADSDWAGAQIVVKHADYDRDEFRRGRAIRNEQMCSASPVNDEYCRGL